jgi:hypothetical protein
LTHWSHPVLFFIEEACTVLHDAGKADLVSTSAVPADSVSVAIDGNPMKSAQVLTRTRNNGALLRGFRATHSRTLQARVCTGPAVNGNQLSERMPRVCPERHTGNIGIRLVWLAD